MVPDSGPAPKGAAAGSQNSHGVVLELRSITKRFGATIAVDAVSFSIRAGEVFTLLGPSGCGKSTTLRIVAGLEQPDEGEIVLRERTIVSARQGLFVPPERRNMGMVFQSYAIWPHFTVFENVAFPLQLRKWGKAQIRERVLDTLEVVGLAGLDQRPATMLSGGQQQRVALARALVYSPDILLLDEPLSNLDAKLREHMRVELRSIQQRLGISVLFVTHDQAEAMTLSDQVAVMNAGHIEQAGPPAEVYERPASTFVRDFLGRALVLRGLVERSGQRTLLNLAAEDGRTLDLEGRSPESLGDGQRVTVSFRPEDVQVAAAAAVGVNRISAVVTEVAYLGERIEYTVRTGGGQSFTVFGARRDRFTVGAEVDLVLNTADVSIWPE